MCASVSGSQEAAAAGEATARVAQSTVEILNYLLQRASNFLPIRKAELLPLVDHNRAALNAHLPNVIEILRSTYGIQWSELPECRGQSAANKKYVLISVTEAASVYELTPVQARQHTLLWLVLSYIFLRAPSVTEKQLQSYLSLLGIEIREHAYFGNVKKLVEETFVKQLYLRREKVDAATQDETTFNYSWGSRAELEFSKRDMLAFVAKLIKQPTTFFMQQHNMVMEEEAAATASDASQEMGSTEED